MKKFLKIGFFVLVGCVVLGIAVSSCGGGESENTDSKETTKEQTNKKTEKKEPKQHKIGQDIKVGDVVFKVHETKTASNVGGEFGQKAQGKYLIVDVSVTNKGDKAITTDATFFKLKADGKEYEADSVATTYANENTDFFLSQVNPDIENRGKVVFDVSENVIKAKDLELNVQTGFFGTEQETISLK